MFRYNSSYLFRFKPGTFDGLDNIFRIQQLRLHCQYLIGVVYIHIPRLYTLFPVEERSDLGKTIGTIDICFKLNGFHNSSHYLMCCFLCRMPKPTDLSL